MGGGEGVEEEGGREGERREVGKEVGKEREGGRKEENEINMSSKCRFMCLGFLCVCLFKGVQHFS